MAPVFSFDQTSGLAFSRCHFLLSLRQHETGKAWVKAERFNAWLAYRLWHVLGGLGSGLALGGGAARPCPRLGTGARGGVAHPTRALPRTEKVDWRFGVGRQWRRGKQPVLQGSPGRAIKAGNRRLDHAIGISLWPGFEQRYPFGESTVWHRPP